MILMNSIELLMCFEMLSMVFKIERMIEFWSFQMGCNDSKAVDDHGKMDLPSAKEAKKEKKEEVKEEKKRRR